MDRRAKNDIAGEIEKRPAIWDLESPDYANRILKRRSWEELVSVFSDKDDSEEKKKDLDTSENSETGNEESTADAREDIMRPPNQNIKRKKMTAADAEFLNIINKNISCRNQQQPLLSSVMEGDDDKLFCLSLHKELLKVPEANRIAVKLN
ncbi:unnamed protein product [Acanthoscelides obtectus]|uniref:MADF domain-containing protein n=1 Tax=Acanthoscelides obtectus TaxID=200917 RepID=A0A9P0Q906_ACAOB|nr:unnamed protein product [Acanthoscelides obtectus]CAK1642470.1 hypothetical protein AOBTE_LOCUS13044 [Acanthoscelides obtectus]